MCIIILCICRKIWFVWSVAWLLTMILRMGDTENVRAPEEEGNSRFYEVLRV